MKQGKTINLEFNVGDTFVDHDWREYEVKAIYIIINLFDEMTVTYKCLDDDVESYDFTEDDARIYRG